MNSDKLMAVTIDDVIDAKRDLMSALDEIAPNQAHDSARVMAAISHLIQVNIATHLQNSHFPGRTESA